MNIIKLKEANCRNCYKCIRECPVKSISFSREQAQIIDNACVLCGHCLSVCPQQAKEIVSDIGKVRSFLAGKSKVYVSLAPSYSAYFKGISLGQMSAALKKLGFAHLEETAVGAAKVSEQYEALIQQGTMRNIITSACPTVVLLIEKYFPDLLDYLAPVAPPVIAHAQAMTTIYANRIKVVFIGPCISKKHDVIDPLHGGVLAAALSFEELEQMMAQSGVTFAEEDPEQRGLKKPVARFYPLPGGIIRTLARPVRQKYKCISIDGMDRCVKTLQDMRAGDLSDYFIEMNACEGGCIGGPSLKNVSFFNARDRLATAMQGQDDSRHHLPDDTDVHIHRQYLDLSALESPPPEEAIRATLARIGKYTAADELNCGGCGYASCRDKAVAVLRGKAEAQMCLPYMRQRAESMSNTILDVSPNAIFALDESLAIQQVNPAACAMLKTSADALLGKYIEEFLPCDMYDEPSGAAPAVRTAQQSYPRYGIVVEQTVVRVPQNRAVVLILKDITAICNQELAQKQMRESTIAVTQKVIEKQMRVAQEIASLLGETTAETKLALTRLKKSMSDEGDAG